MRRVLNSLVVILWSVFVLPLTALAVPLDSLIDSGASITQGDKVFDNFTGSLSAFRASPESLSEVDVSGITVGGAHGLRVSGGFFAAGSVEQQEGSGVILSVEFDVTAIDPHRRIHGITLVLPDAELSGFASVSASAAPAFVSAFHDEFFGSIFVGPLSDVRTFSSNVTSMHIDAGLGVSTASMGGAITGGFNVTFPQSVPEPSILLSFGAGAILVIVMAREREGSARRQ